MPLRTLVDDQVPVVILFATTTPSRRTSTPTEPGGATQDSDTLALPATALKSVGPGPGRTAVIAHAALVIRTAAATTPRTTGRRNRRRPMLVSGTCRPPRR